MKGKENFPSSTDEALRKLKLLLKEVVPHLLAKNGSKQYILSANTYLMQQESSLGLTWKILNRDQLLHNLGWLKITLIESLDSDVFSKVLPVSRETTGSCDLWFDVQWLHHSIHISIKLQPFLHVPFPFSIGWKTTTGCSSEYSSTNLQSTTHLLHVQAQCQK